MVSNVKKNFSLKDACFQNGKPDELFELKKKIGIIKLIGRLRKLWINFPSCSQIIWLISSNKNITDFRRQFKYNKGNKYDKRLSK